MHPALGIEDIIRLILDHISKDDHYHVALVCRGFLEPALDVIWDTLDPNPIPLFNLWPADAIKVSARTAYFHYGPAWIVDLLRELSTNERDRLVYYAKRVRKLVWRTKDLIAPSFVRHLTASFTHPGSPSILLPNLQSLRTPSGPGFDTISHIFVSPSLRDLEYRYAAFEDEEESFTQAILQSLTTNQHSLTSLSIQDSGSSPAGSQHILKIIGATGHRLRSIKLMTLRDWEVLRTLGSLPELREMKLVLHMQEEEQELLEDVSSSWFPVLRVIHADMDVALRILSTSNAAPWIEELFINGERSSATVTPNTMSRLINLIGSTCVSVRKIELRLDGTSDLQISLAPLAKCSNLRHFELLDNSPAEALTDEEYQELLLAWSHLQHLQVTTNSKPRATGATLKLLESLMKSGPLEFLDVRIAEIEIGAEGTGEGIRYMYPGTDY